MQISSIKPDERHSHAEWAANRTIYQLCRCPDHNGGKLADDRQLFISCE